MSRFPRDIVPKHMRQIAQQRSSRCADIHNQELHTSLHSLFRARSVRTAARGDSSPAGYPLGELGSRGATYSEVFPAGDRVVGYCPMTMTGR